MEKQKHLIMHLILTVFSLLTLTGCEEDWWDSRVNDLTGTWHIVEATGNRDCNFVPGDSWILYPSNEYVAVGAGGFYEHGDWERRGRKIYIYFQSPNPEIVAYVRNLDDDYMVLDVDDYTYQSSYTLRMVRQSY